MRTKINFTTPQPPSKLALLLKNVLPQRRIRIMTMIRDPVALYASNWAMWMCPLNRGVTEWNYKRQTRGLNPQCQGMNVSEIVDQIIQEYSSQCHQKGISRRARHACRALQNGTDPLPHCRSARALLESKQYDMLHNMYAEVMGGYYTTRGQTVAEHTIIAKLLAEENALQDLGGLETPNGEADFVWFGITERMFESVCLLYYSFRVNTPSSMELPTDRVMKCSPITWWTDDDKRKARLREPLDDALYRAANAILDVRLVKMRNEIQRQLDAGTITLDDMPFVGHGCFENQSPT
jgi:hypothetical protein